ncbi:tetratricopeptide repeat protein [Marinobacter halotolerans]|uniref:tetratricopeptide repeat protein n=1 Tax=Marinobacter halotolerans TaxID=1569211 RepID=UPI001785AED3|nr:tetratricopeptide repeat protein [Marinobacter halotolerans]
MAAIFSGPQEPDSSDASRYENERQTLFNQPYIDPLTDYLIEYQGDPDRTEVLRQVRRERDRRCDKVADEYGGEPATEVVLERYNISYGYSCPEQVANFENRVDRQESQKELEPESKTAPETESQPVTAEIPEPADPVDKPVLSDQALSDCYLLTTIRNFSAARKACLEPAEKGDVRSQANMAVIAHAFEDYTSAFEWAEKAAAGSADAAFLLGQMFARGQGVSQNMNKAVYWYRQAASQGHKEARVALDSQPDTRPEGEL